MPKGYAVTVTESGAKTMQEKLIREIANSQTVFNPSAVINAGAGVVFYDDWFQFALVVWNRLTRPEHGIWQLETKVPITEAFSKWLDAVEAAFDKYPA